MKGYHWGKYYGDKKGLTPELSKGWSNIDGNKVYHCPKCKRGMFTYMEIFTCSMNWGEDRCDAVFNWEKVKDE